MTRPFDHNNIPTHEGRVAHYRSIINNHGANIKPGLYDRLYNGAPTSEDKDALADAWVALGLEVA